jgi:hypothetical protein
MIIFIVERSAPIKLNIFPTAESYGIKPVVVGYDTSGFKPGEKIPVSKVPTVTEDRLVVTDTLGTEYWYSPKEYLALPFDSAIYQAMRADPTRYILNEKDQLVLNPDWQEPYVVIEERWADSFGDLEGAALVETKNGKGKSR